jgi:hypothetical protein
MIAEPALMCQVLGEAFPGEIDDAVCGGKDRLRRTIVAVEGDDLCPRTELLGKIENVANGGSPEGIDRLRIVANDCETPSSRLQRQQNR